MVRILELIVSGSITRISFTDFLKKTNVREISDDKKFYMFNSKNAVNLTDDSDTSSYTRTSIMLSSIPKQEKALMDLVSQSGIRHTYKRDLMELLEDAAAASMYQFGNPQYLVRIFPRTWFLGNPETFTIVSNKHGVALVTDRPFQSVLLYVDRISENKILEKVKKDYPQIDLEKSRKNLRIF